MAALTTQSGNLVWSLVKNALSAAQVGSVGVNPAVQRALLDGLKQYLAGAKRNPDLQFIPIDGVATASDGGNADQVGASGAMTLYAIYLQKTGTTETIFKASNHATVAGTDGTQDVAIALTTPAGSDVLEIYPGGRALSLGFTYCENTTRTGSTRNLKANAASGFAIVGA